MEEIKNIFCVGRNYAAHAKELNNAVPTAPIFFSKPTHAVAEADGRLIALPGDAGAVHYETEWVVHIARPYEKGIEADDLIDKMALGIDLTLRDVQSRLKEKRHPWLLAKGFRQSAVLTRFIPFPGTEACKRIDFSLLKNGEEAQKGNIRQMIFDLQTLVDYCAEHFGLGEGDILFTGTPEGVGPVSNGDRFALKWGEETLGTFSVSLKNI